MKDSSTKFTRFAATALSLLFLSSLVLLEYFIFQWFLDDPYLKFWIDQGPMIAFSITLIGLVWSDLDKQHPDLISAHPGFYLRTCIVIMSGVFLAITNSIPGKKSMEKLKSSKVSMIPFKYNAFIGVFIYIILSLVAFVWFLCVAPTMYFVTLITGAPARLAMMSKSDQIPMERSSIDTTGTTTSESFILSFANKPVIVTATLTGGFLTFIKFLELY